MYEAKKLKQNKAKIALKQRKANSQKLEQKANKQKTNTAKKATHQKKKECEVRKTKKHKPRVSRPREGRVLWVLGATWSRSWWSGEKLQELQAFRLQIFVL